jgi:ABC-2 type transport system ATP-binding protein
MNALSVRGLTKTYKNGVQALKGVDLDVEQGDFFALLGPNGAGKTTLIGIVTSLVNKTEGHASVFGHDIDRELEAAKACIGVVPQELNFNQFETPYTIVVNQAGFYGIPRPVARERAERYLKQLQLWDKRDKMSRGLSGGMKRRLMIARALMHEPRLLILDEPTAGVDIEIRRSMWDFLREINARGTTIILTTHYLEEAETLCRNIAIINGGLIVERDRMSSLLRRLNTETFVFNLRNLLSAAPKLEGYGTTTLVDDHTLEIEMAKEQNLNDVFSALSALGIEVLSMRNKVNRLEEIFMRLVEGHANGKGGGANSVAPASAGTVASSGAIARRQGGHP